MFSLTKTFIANTLLIQPNVKFKQIQFFKTVIDLINDNLAFLSWGNNFILGEQNVYSNHQQNTTSLLKGNLAIKLRIPKIQAILNETIQTLICNVRSEFKS